MRISFDGVDGVGKSTFAQMFAFYLKEKGHPVLLTKEPTVPCVTPHEFISDRIRLQYIHENPFLTEYRGARKIPIIVKDRSVYSSYHIILAGGVEAHHFYKASGVVRPTVKYAVLQAVEPTTVTKTSRVNRIPSIEDEYEEYMGVVRARKERGPLPLSDYEKIVNFYRTSEIFDGRIMVRHKTEDELLDTCDRLLKESLSIYERKLVRAMSQSFETG